VPSAVLVPIGAGGDPVRSPAKTSAGTSLKAPLIVDPRGLDRLDDAVPRVHEIQV
jgi:hypothetical protein